ncbi:PqqD family protein [Pseudarthrobacter sp. J75]|uniref:PqqD family protein n=1 Tax=unclassified Pseudarthrobacter TaxID=2647000 RepID=UPI002E7FFA4B|nr:MULTISPECIES: PqqD family protein [unclassified Pseudarthrobacter]MEE2522138.1 PqqD family protein [Pseudarthrobacter sp. J47]MEE2528216.1 PqqD family protein [Pseudarthrobacter sp. J75]
MSFTVWRKASLVAEVTHDGVDRVALLHLDADQPVVLEGPAARIWGLIDGVSSEGKILEELAEYYGEPISTIAAQTADFLNSLAEQQLIESVPVTS